MKYNYYFLFTLLMGLTCGEEERPTLSIPDGTLMGTMHQTVGKNITFFSFRGVPFAKKPVGNLRFASPVENDPWTGILDATKDKDVCVQTTTVAGGSDMIGSEDCLYINVYTTDTNGSLPVMVWIYGGGFSQGSSTYGSYAPDYLIEKGVIFASFNYRLGCFGFLSTEDSIAPGNWGLKDQVLALKWIKKNIAYFGGDPEKVTIFGQSAGSASVSYLVQSNLTQGLFRGAIMESGTSLCLWALTRNARHKAFNIGIKLGIFTLSSKTLIDKLRKADYRALKLADANVTLESFLLGGLLAGLPFGPVNEPAHSGAVFSGKSHQLLKGGKFNKVRLIIGFNSYEGVVLEDYVSALRPAFVQYDLDVTKLAPYDLSENIIKRLGAGISIRRKYFQPGPLGNQNITKFVSIDQFNRPIRESVNIMSNYTNVYYYQFSYKGRLGDSNITYQGVGHAEEIPYLFVTPREATEEDKETRKRMVTLWTNFAKTGNPIPSEDNSALLQGTTWIPNSPGDNTRQRIKYFNINHTLTMENNPDQCNWNFYQGIYNKYGDPPYTTY